MLLTGAAFLSQSQWKPWAMAPSTTMKPHSIMPSSQPKLRLATRPVSPASWVFKLRSSVRTAEMSAF